MKKMNKSLKATLILCVLGLAVVFQCCGRKAPPIPPGAIVPPRVGALSHAIRDNTLTLSWTAPEGKGSKAVDGYDVMRSMTSQDQEECKGCPIVFERIARLGTSKTSYTDTLVPGKRYIYKVVPVTSYQVQGKDSKLIRFSYPEEKKKEIAFLKEKETKAQKLKEAEEFRRRNNPTLEERKEDLQKAKDNAREVTESLRWMRP